jgi:site-specific DNA-methyltransferase (adenine-specific)
VASKELGRFFVGAERERPFAELAGRRMGAAVRGEVLRELPGAEVCNPFALRVQADAGA